MVSHGLGSGENVSSVGIVAPTPGDSESHSGHIATRMIVNVLLIYHEEVHVYTQSVAVMSFDHPEVYLHQYSKPFNQSPWVQRMIGQLIYQFKYCWGIFATRPNMIIFGGSGFVLPMSLSKLLGIFTIYRVGGVIQREQMSQSAFTKIWSAFLKSLQNYIYLISDLIIVIGPSLINFADIGNYEGKIAVWCHYYFDLNKFDITKQYNSRNDRIGYVGIISEVKGTIQLIESVEDLDRTVFSDLLIVGDGPQYDNAKKLVKNNDLPVKFAGRVNRNQVPIYYNQMKLLILNSKTEGMPKVVLEGMACGTPVLAQNVGAVQDFVIDGYNGFLMESEENWELSNNINDILASGELNDISQNARSYVKNNFSFKTTAQSYCDMINNHTSLKVQKQSRISEPISRP